jgi:hypothetical protein
MDKAKVSKELVKLAKDLLSGTETKRTAGYDSDDGIGMYLNAIEELERDIVKARHELERGKLGLWAQNLAAKLDGGSYTRDFYRQLYG